MLVAVTGLVAACGGQGSEPDVDRGRDLYAENCQSCHGVAATGEGRAADVPVHADWGHTWHHADGQIVDIVLGGFTYPGRRMPSFEGTLEERDVEDILAYIKQGWTAEQRAAQEEVSRNWRELNE